MNNKYSCDTYFFPVTQISMSVSLTVRVVTTQTVLTMMVVMTVTVILGTLEMDWCVQVSTETWREERREKREKVKGKKVLYIKYWSVWISRVT